MSTHEEAVEVGTRDGQAITTPQFSLKSPEPVKVIRTGGAPDRILYAGKSLEKQAVVVDFGDGMSVEFSAGWLRAQAEMVRP
jgi:hypothetical protein